MPAKRLRSRASRASHSSRAAPRTEEPLSVQQWREWITHQYEPGYWTGRRIPPFLADAPGRTVARRNPVRWYLAIPLLALLLLSSIPVVMHVVGGSADPAAIRGRDMVQRAVDFPLVFPCDLPPGLSGSPSTALYPAPPPPPYMPAAVSIRYSPEQSGGPDLSLTEQRDVGLKPLPGGPAREIDDVDVISVPSAGGNARVGWVRDGVRFELIARAMSSDQLMAVARSMIEGCG